MNLANFSQWLTNVSLNALCRRNRQIVILQGSNLWANSLLQQVETYFLHGNFSLAPSQAKTWYVYSDSTTLEGNVNKQTYRNKLGTESDFVVFYSDEINIDALAALSGTLVSGGVLFFVLPVNIMSSTFVNESYFNTRLIAKLFNQPDIKILLEEDNFFKKVTESNNYQLQSNTPKEAFEMGCLTAEQLTAVQKIIQVVKGHRNRPLVLTADRGRGKSSALAIACAYLLTNSTTNIKIVITATHRKSLSVFFKQLATNVAEHEACESAIEGNIFEHKSGSVEFITVDELISNKNIFHLVIVDEAASIPLYLLNQLSEQYHRMVFATTIHGYEGAGRSFTLKFKDNLAKKYPEYKTLNISEPIRWAENDPLESFIYNLCLLNAELPHIPKIIGNSKLGSSLDGNVKSKVESKAYHFTVVTAKELSLNEALLKQVFAVLVTAHYQTSPNDLQLLLDNKNITVVILCYQDQVVGVALLIKEGKADKQGVELVKNNKRRLKDQFIPQSLLSYCGEENSFDYSYLRVMRIAIIPELQGQGKGTLFLSYIEQYAKQHTIDFVGTSFGVNQQLLNFWQLQKYNIARIGFTKDKSSGEHSALLIKPMNKEHEAFTQAIEQAFYQSFDYLLAEQYKALSPELVWQVMTYCPEVALPEITEGDLKTVEDFYTKKRQYSVCVYSLHKWLQHQMKKPFDAAMEPMISKVFQRNEVTYLASKYEFTGKKSFNSHLIQFTQKYFEQ